MYKISLAVFNRMLYIVTIQSHAHARKYVTYACIREHIQGACIWRDAIHEQK